MTTGRRRFLAYDKNLMAQETIAAKDRYFSALTLQEKQSAKDELAQIFSRRVQNKLLTKPEAAVLYKNETATLDEEQAEYDLLGNPSFVLAELVKGKKGIYKNIQQDNRTKLIKQAETTIEKIRNRADRELDEAREKRGSELIEIWATELEKPLTERTITPKFLRDEHRAGNITDSDFTSMMNNLLAIKKAEVKEIEIEAKTKAEEDIRDKYRKMLKGEYTLTEDEIHEAKEREENPISAGFAITMINAVRSLEKKEKLKPSPLEKIMKYNELVERNVALAKREWFIKRAPFEDIAKFRADVIDANTQEYITDAQMKELLSETSKTFYRNPVFQNALDQLAAQSKLYATSEAQARVKAEMYGNLITKVIAGKEPREAVVEVIKEKLNTELNEAIKTGEVKDKRIADIIGNLRKKNTPDSEIAKFMREKGLDPEIYGVKE